MTTKVDKIFRAIHSAFALQISSPFVVNYGKYGMVNIFQEKSQMF